jgi:uncharacterized protein YebE (UPF0316 family)
MTSDVIFNCGVIFFARVADVSLGTIRTIAVIRGSRMAAWWLGFFEIFIWIWIVSKVIHSVSETPVYSLFYALGFATGNYVGMTVERWIAIGDRALLLFTRRPTKISRAFQTLHYAVTEWQGNGKDGPITLLFLKIPRRSVRPVIQTAKAIDPACFFVVETVEHFHSLQPTPGLKTGWQARARKAK